MGRTALVAVQLGHALRAKARRWTAVELANRLEAFQDSQPCRETGSSDNASCSDFMT